jgi:diadenosine tetraphosphate (Ap4A) HIT family hydrolase
MVQRDPLCKVAKHGLRTVSVLRILTTLYPAKLGHVLVLPKQHTEDIYSLQEDLASRTMIAGVKMAMATLTIHV